MSSLSCLQSKNVSLNQEVPQISAGINPCHTYHVHDPKLVLQIKKSVEITPGIKPHDVYHVYSY